MQNIREEERALIQALSLEACFQASMASDAAAGSRHAFDYLVILDFEATCDEVPPRSPEIAS